MFSCTFCEISKNTFSTEHLWATTSVTRTDLIHFKKTSKNWSLTFQKCWFYLLQGKPFKNYEKCFLFHLKSSFHSWDYYIFGRLTFLCKKTAWQESQGKFQNLWHHKPEADPGSSNDEVKILEEMEYFLPNMKTWKKLVTVFAKKTKFRKNWFVLWSRWIFQVTFAASSGPL